jgi:hypothetical protein
MSGRSRAVEEILDRLHEEAERAGKVSVGDTVAALSNRGWGPFLFVPAIIEISPIGGVPGVPTVLALIIAIFAAQISWGREHMWLPGFLSRRNVSAGRMRGAVEKMRPVGRWLDKLFHSRLQQLTTDRVTRVAAVFALLLCLTVPPLELFPFASTAPMAAIAMFGLAFMFCDGLLMALGFVLTAVAVAVGFGFWGGGGAGG